MTTVAIAGASGVVGARALHHALARHDVERVVAVGRRPLAVQHPKLSSVVVDLQDRDAVAAALPADVGVALCALGTTMKQAGSKEAFRAVDHDAVVAFGAAARARGAVRFVLVSSIGANARAGNFYLRTKAEAEAALAAQGWPGLVVLRPSFIDDQGARGDHRLAERLALPVARAVFSVVGRTSKYAPVTADAIGRAAVRLAFDDAALPLRVVESDRIHALAG